MSFSVAAQAADLTLVAGHDFRDVFDLERIVDEGYNAGGHVLTFHVTARDASTDLITPPPTLQIATAVVEVEKGVYRLKIAAALHLTTGQIAALSIQTLYDYVITLADSLSEPFPVAYGWLLVQQVG